MAITISGENNNDRILASDGVIDQISGINIVGLITASHINVGSNINLGNAGIITATTFVGNLTGNVNSTSPLLLQTGGSERFRITGNNELGIAGANYGTSGQVLTSGGSGNAVTWSTIPTQITISGNADNRVITGGSGTNLNAESTLTYTGSALTMAGDIVFTNTSTEIKTNSSDGSDNKRIILAGGGDNSQVRGAQLTLYGNEYSSHEGRLQLLAGNSGNSNGVVQMYTGGTERLRITSGGTVNIGGDYTNTTGKLKVTGVVTVDGGFNLTAGSLTAPGGFSISSGNVIISGDIAHDADSDTTFGFGSGADTFRVQTAGSERLRIQSDGKILIAKGTPDTTTSQVQIGNYTTGYSWDNGDVPQVLISGVNNESPTSGTLNIALRVADENNNNMFQIHNRGGGNTDVGEVYIAGKTLIGHTASDDRDGYNSSLQISGTGGDDSSITIGRWSGNQSSPALVFSKSRGPAIGSHTVLQGGDYLGAIQFQGDDGSNYHVGASIQARVENFSGGAGSDDMPTRLFFNTNRDEANVTNRMIIHGRGTDYNVLYGGRVDILGYEGQNITGGTNGNVMNEQLLICPSGASGYADQHTITFGQTKGDWYQGVNSGYNTSYGLLWNWGSSSYASTRKIRAGIHYDHRGQERFKFWSSYGDFVFKTDAARSGDETAETCDTTAMQITRDGHVTKPNQPSCMAYNAQGQMIAGNATAAFNSTRFNIGSHYNTSNGRFTAPIDGRYLVAYSGLHDYQGQAYAGFAVQLNGSNFDGGEAYDDIYGSSDSHQCQLAKTLILNMSANDYVSIFVRSSGTRIHQRYGSFSVCLLT